MRTTIETTTDPSVRRTWRFIPRLSGMKNPPAGAWDDEEDKIQWVDAASDLDCLMLRNRAGGWCGYVGVPQHHQLYGMGYDECRTCTDDSCYATTTTIPHERPNSLVEVHGRLTFSELCSPGEPIDGICHIAEPGREKKPWWFGFDCGHCDDIQPLTYDLIDLGFPESAVYRTEEWVTTEVASLAGQLAAIGR